MEKIDYKGHVIGIFDDDISDENPREWDTLGILLTFHRSNDFTDRDAPSISHSDFDGWDEMEEHLIKKEKAVIVLPVYALMHGGITISTTPYNDPWDSGQLGFIYTTRDRIKSITGGSERLTKKLKEQVTNEMIGEIETLDLCLQGNGYGYVIDPVDDTDEEGPHEEYCGNYYDKEAPLCDAKASIKRIVKVEKEAEWIKTMPLSELPKYMNHKWAHPLHEEMFLERMKAERLTKNPTPA
jgi:hypothetical protein